MNKQVDTPKVQSLLQAAEREMDFTKQLSVTKQSTATIVRNVYEAFRMIGEALLVAKGVRSQEHVDMINALLYIPVQTARPLSVLDELRRLRNLVNYEGYWPSVREAQDALSIADACFSPLLAEVKHMLC